jgi:hypothetical protein
MTATIKLGKHAPRFDTRVPRLEAHLTRAALPAPPAKKDWPKAGKIATWGMMLNDRLGDCVIAAKGHAILEWTALAGLHKSVKLPDSTILAGYEAIGGYVPGRPDTDNGCDMLTAAQYFQSTGFGGHRISAFATLGVGKAMSVSHWQEAINLFGSIDIGLAMPAAWRSKTKEGDVWDAGAGQSGDWSPGSWGGHDVLLTGYDAAAKVYQLVTWGQIQLITEAALIGYCDEAYTYLSPDWLYNGTAPNRYQLAELQRDLQLESTKVLPKVNWPAVLAFVQSLIKQYGPASVPLIEAFVSTLPLTPAQIKAIEELIHASFAATANLVSETTRGW